MAVTLADVAKQAGVSVATVSRVLNNKMVMPISEATIARIRDAATELGYRANPVARALATGRTNALGLFSDEITDPHFAQMLEAVEERATALGYQLLVSASLRSLLENSRTDGTILLGLPGSFPDLEVTTRPVVYVNNAHTPMPHLIAWDDAQGMRQVIEYLAELGHTQIAALWCYGEPFPQVSRKVEGFRSATSALGLKTIECWDKVSPHRSEFAAQFEDGYHAVKRLLDAGTPFTAIVARNDFLALGALRALREVRIQVPEEVSVVGYTDSVHAVCADPPLTSVRTPIAEAGVMAVDQLVAAIIAPDQRFDNSFLPTSLIVRDSTGFAKQASQNRLRQEEVIVAAY
jgi:LacI family transcriptional regulator